MEMKQKGRKSPAGYYDPRAPRAHSFSRALRAALLDESLA